MTPAPSAALSAQNASSQRLAAIAQARQALSSAGDCSSTLVAPWITRSWQRCLQAGLRPQESADFDQILPAQMRQTVDANAHWVRIARPLLEQLARAVRNTGYFAILTDARGVVVEVAGAIDRSDRRADLITRIGTDLSEQRVGTTAIGAALGEQRPVWLHRGEHFFSNTTAYSCAGAPVAGPNGACVGMLDLTGIAAAERPELAHLVSQVAGKIGNALVQAQNHSLLLRLNWPGSMLGGDTDGLLGLDADGWIIGANALARQLVPGLQGGRPCHASDVFGMPLELLFDAARRSHNTLELPLWNGLWLQAAASTPGQQPRVEPVAAPAVGLKDLESSLIRKAVEQARGNVSQAALALGISRATVYRKLSKK